MILDDFINYFFSQLSLFLKDSVIINLVLLIQMLINSRKKSVFDSKMAINFQSTIYNKNVFVLKIRSELRDWAHMRLFNAKSTV